MDVWAWLGEGVEELSEGEDEDELAASIAPSARATS